MEERNKLIFLIFSLVPAFNLVISTFLQNHLKKTLQQLWLGILIMNLSLLFARIYHNDLGDWVFILPMLTWGLILSPLSRLNKNEKSYLQDFKKERFFYFLGIISFLAMFLLIQKNYPFHIYTIPVSVFFFILSLALLASPFFDHQKSIIEHKIFFIHQLSSFLLVTHFLLLPLWLSKNLSFLDETYVASLFFLSVTSHIFAFYKIKKQHHSDDFIKAKDARNFLDHFSKNFELGLLAPSLTHQIQNPLMIILAKAQQLKRLTNNSVSPEATKAPETFETKNEMKEESVIQLHHGLNQIIKSGERIKHTLEIYREMIYQKDPLQKERISLKEILDNVMLLCEQRLQNHGVSFRHFQIDHKFFFGHKTQSEEIIFNLLQNSFEAIEFLPEKWIEMSCVEDENFLNIFIQDSGSGVPDDIAEKMLDPFVTTKENRLGLGLFLSSKMMKEVGGELIFLKDKKRTTFVLKFPLKPF